MHPGKRVNLDMLFHGKSGLRCLKKPGKLVFIGSQFAQCLALNKTSGNLHYSNLNLVQNIINVRQSMHSSKNLKNNHVFVPTN